MIASSLVSTMEANHRNCSALSCKGDFGFDPVLAPKRWPNHRRHSEFAVVKSPKIQLSEIESITQSRHVCDDVLRQIARTKAWMKSYKVKLNLVNNSKTPVPVAMKLIPQLRELDLRKLAKSKNVPAAIATQARRYADTKKFG